MNDRADFNSVNFPWVIVGRSPCCSRPIDPGMTRAADGRWRCPHCDTKLYRIRVRELGDIEMRFLTFKQLRGYGAWRNGKTGPLNPGPRSAFARLIDGLVTGFRQK